MSVTTHSLAAHPGHVSQSLADAITAKSNIGWVYLIEGAGLHKIGTSVNVKKRLASLSVGSPVSLTLVAVGAGGEQQEAKLHAVFAKYHHHGEWFDLTPGQVNQCIDLMGGVRLPSTPDEAWRVIDSLPSVRPTFAPDGVCVHCRGEFVATDTVRWIDGDPYHGRPCYMTRRQQIYRAKERRKDFLAGR